jgi:hypothetical protein
MLIAIVRVVVCFVLAVKVPALLSSKVLAPKGRIKLVVSRGLVLRVVVKC